MTPSPRHTPYRAAAIFRRVPWVLPGTLLLLAGVGPAAYAFWESVSSNTAAAAADVLAPGGKPTAAASGATLSVNWAAASTTAGRPVSGYTLTRYASATGGTGIPATGTCAGTVTSLNCSESGVQGGVWYYTVTPSIALWKGAESPRSDGVSNDSTAPEATASVTPTPNAAGWNNTSPVTFTVSAQDEAGGSGVASITYRLDSGAPVAVNAATAIFPISGDGTHTVSYSATDKAGNVSTAKAQTVKIDTSMPAVPVLSVPAYVYSGNVTAVPVTGTAEANATVTLTASDAGSAHTVPVQTTASSTGSWTVSMNLTSLNQGTVSYSATVTDAAGNTGTATTATNTKDTSAPAVGLSSVPAYVYSGNVNAVPVTGTAEANAKVTLTASDAGSAHTVPVQTTASSTGSWNVSPNLTSLNQGTVTYSAMATDAAGNTATATATNTKDTSAPAVGLSSVPAYVSNGSGSGKVTAVSVTGTAEAGSSVKLTVSDTTAPTPRTASGTANSTGSWSVTGLNLSLLADGPITYSAVATDAAGNTATAVGTGKKDTAAPTVTDIALGGDNSGTLTKGDTVKITYSEVMSTFCTGFTPGYVTITDGADTNNDVLTLDGCNAFGTVALGGNYVGTSSARFGANGIGNGNGSSLSWDATGKILTITLGEPAKNLTLLTSLSGTPSYTPTAALTDAAGNPITTTPVTSATATKF